MKRLPGLFIFLMIIIVVSVLFVSVRIAQCASFQPDILIKINRVEHALNLIDSMIESGPTQPMQSPSTFIRAMLKGTDWLDPQRCIVIGITFKRLKGDLSFKAPLMAALIPFAKPNDNFKLAYNAVSGDDYYIIPLPPESAKPVTAQMEQGLVTASKSKPAGILSVEVAASRLIEKADQQIQKKLLDLEQKMPKQQPGTELSPQDAKKMIENMLATASQMQAVRMGLDITEKDVVISSDVDALKGTDLYRLFDRPMDSYSSFMTSYLPRYQINFRSNSYDIKGMLDFFNLMFGEFYKKIGMDLAEIEPMAVNFTGEMAGGVSFGRSGIDFEMIVVRHKTDKSGQEFLESEYMPWIMDYSQKITDLFNQANPKAGIKNLFSKTPDSVVDGHKVFGVKGEIPIVSPVSGASDKFSLEMRLTTVDNFMLTASSDERLRHLIQIAKGLEKQPTAGPLMQAEIDLGRCLKFIQKEISKAGLNTGGSFPKLGSLFYTLNMKSGSLNAKYRMHIDDIKSIASSLKQFAGSRQTARGGYPATRPPLPYAKPPAGPTYERQPPAALSKDNPRYWMNKGLLFATYGNDKAAIKCFKKAIDLDPKNSSAYFNLGLSYSEMKEYKKSISAIRKAIKLNPENGAYHYGLGWVYLLSGDSETGLKNIQEAADMGSMDAERYLDKRALKAK